MSLRTDGHFKKVVVKTDLTVVPVLVSELFCELFCIQTAFVMLLVQMESHVVILDSALVKKDMKALNVIYVSVDNMSQIMATVFVSIDFCSSIYQTMLIKEDSKTFS